jgi:glycosyltransferase involved in cell wall biosynthesis
VPEVWFVLPPSVDDPAAPSGGNRYDLRVRDGLRAQGRQVRPVVAPGSWPLPSADDLAGLGRLLEALPAGAVVLLDGLVACAAPGVLAAQTARLRVVVLVHLPLADETGLDPGLARDLDAGEGQALRGAAVVVATSHATARRILGRHGLDPARLHVAPPGVDAAPPAAPSAGGARLLCVAALTPRKGHDTLVAALARISDLPWSCTCAGPLDRAPEHAAGVRRRAAALGDRVTFPGPVTGAALEALYAGADLLVLASRAEPYGMVVTEALARAVPVIVADVDGVGEALGVAPGGERPGLLVPPDDGAALAAALREWLTDGALRDRLRRAAARRRPQLRDWAATSADLAAALQAAA